MNIPVIGTAVVNSSFWVARLLMSIDYPVDNFFIVNNNGRGQLDQELDDLKKINHKFVKKISVTNLPANIGCSGAWNLIIKCFMQSPYWIIANDDVAFGPGFLEEMVSVVNSDPEAGLIHGNPGDFTAGSWDLFLLRDHVVREYGLFDENLYPAYCEDADYLMRFIHRPVKRVLSLNKMYYHGLGEKSEYYTHGSQTKKTEPELTEKLLKCNELNIDYLTQKWGPGWRTCSPSQFPLDGQLVPISYTKYDLDFVRKKHLGF